MKQIEGISNPLIALVGPTGSGKTRLGIEIAKEIGGEIVSADSRLVYRGMNIGTAKPSPEEMRIVPHHMIDIIEPDQPYSMVQYCRQAELVISKIHKRGSLPILVGGSGQYVRAMLENWQTPAPGPNKFVRQVLTEAGQVLGEIELHRRLALIDPDAGSLIDPSNVRRTVRALEVILTTGRKFSEQRKKGIPKYSSLMLGIRIDRKRLFNNIDARVEEMISKGLLAEVKELIQKYGFQLPALEAIGYKQLIKHLKGECSLNEAILEIKNCTHRFVRRQANWFRENDPRIIWVDLDQFSTAEIVKIIERPDNWQIVHQECAL